VTARTGAETADVVISGYGPTGQAAAALLARQGHSIVVFEKHDALYGMPRAATIDGECARIVQAAGDVDRAFRVSSWLRKYELVDEKFDEIVTFDYSGLHMCGFPGRTSFYQPDVEDVLDTAAREHGAEVNFGWEVTDLDVDDGGVTVRARPRIGSAVAAPDSERVLRARYVIGADGANSAVRSLSSIEREDFGYRDAFLGVDAQRIGEMPERLSRGVAIGVCDPGRHTAFIPIGSNRFRFEFIVNPDESHEHLLSDEVAYELLRETWGLGPDQVRVYRHVIYPFEGKVAKTWRAGRILLAGDAAHLMPPFMGQGACSGLRDSINLAWKLHMVLAGLSDESLLDTYEMERGPHALHYVKGSIEVGLVACERDPERAKQRNEAYRNGTMPPPPPDATLTAGILHRGPDGKLAKHAGELIEQGIVRVGNRTGRFDDIIGWGFHLIGYELDPLDHLDDEGRHFLEEIGCVAVRITTDPDIGAVLDLDRTYEAFFKDRNQIKAVLARPDFYIFGAVWNAADLQGMVDDLRRQLVGQQVPIGSDSSARV
jgi:3-(3-hydroxy-phenyl)propionate hydroxylase